VLYLAREVVEYLAVAFVFEVESKYVFHLGSIAQLSVVQLLNQVFPLLLAREETELHQLGQNEDGVVDLLHNAFSVAELVILAFQHDLFDAV